MGKPTIEAESAAAQAKADAVKARKAAEAKPADLSRIRGDHGSVMSLRSNWVHDEGSLDRATLDLEGLREHLPVEALHKAIRSYIKAGGRELDGVRIFEQHKTGVR